MALAQGNIFSLLRFNIAVDVVVCYWLSVIADDKYQTAAHGLRALVSFLLVLFYADENLLGVHSKK